MMPRRLAKSSATRCSISRTCLPMRSAVGPPFSTATTAAISSSSWTLPAYSMRTRGLMRNEPAVGQHDLTGDEAAGVGREEEGRADHLVRVGHAPLEARVGHHLLRGLRVVAHHVG